MAKLNPHVFMEISINKDLPERVLIELFADDVPRTAEKFRARCTGEAHPDLCLKGACFNHIIKGFSAAVCDDSGKGTGGQSTDVGEKGSRNHDEGVLSMANGGNGPCFLILFLPQRHLDGGDRVVFGKVVGRKSVLRKMEDVGSIDGKPSGSVKITDSGEMSRIRAPEREKAKGRHKKEEETESDGKRTRSIPSGVSKYIRKGRGFTEKFSFARRYSTPPPLKSDRTRDRYPSNSSLRRRPRSPPRRRSPFPLRYNRMIRKTSRSPDGDRFRDRSRSQSPRRHSRSRSPRKRQPIIQDRLGTQKSSIKGGPTSPAE